MNVTWQDVPFSARERLLAKYEQNPNSVADAADTLGLTLVSLQRRIRDHRDYSRAIFREGIDEAKARTIIDALFSLHDAAEHPPALEVPRTLCSQGPARLMDIEVIDPLTDQALWLDRLLALQHGKGRITFMHLCDIHFTYEDEGSLEVAYQLVEHTQPDVIVVGSDAADFAMLSSFDIDPDIEAEDEDVEVLDQFEAFWNEHIRRLRKIAPNAVLVYVLGNHELRFYRFIEHEAPALRKRRERDFERIVRCGGAVLWLGDTYDWVRIGPLVMHGNRVGVGAARLIFNDLGGQTSVIFGHVHWLSDHEVMGEDFPVGAHASGCLCQLQPRWVKRGRMRRKWQPGTIVAEVDLNTREVKVNNLRFEKEADWTWVSFERTLFAYPRQS